MCYYIGRLSTNWKGYIEMSIANKEVPVKVKFFNGMKGFGFFATAGRPDAYFHVSMLAEQGFVPADMVEGAIAVIDYGPGKKKGQWVASKIHRVGSRMAKPEFTRTLVDHEGDRVIVKVKHLVPPDPPFYEVRQGNSNGQLLEEHYSLTAARSAIGKVIQPPTPIGYGKKTNVPGNGPAKGTASGKSEKKKAA